LPGTRPGTGGAGPRASKALREFVAANAHFLVTLGAQGRAVLATGLVDPDARAVIQGTYVTARRAAITELVDDSTTELRGSW
jgi:hypothetical protein